MKRALFGRVAMVVEPTDRIGVETKRVGRIAVGVRLTLGGRTRQVGQDIVNQHMLDMAVVIGSDA